jgi:hypothetical protein
MNTTPTIHLMEARHAYRMGDKNGCNVKGPGVWGTVELTSDVEKTECLCCKRWYWHSEGLVAAPHVLAELGI